MIPQIYLDSSIVEPHYTTSCAFQHELLGIRDKGRVFLRRMLARVQTSFPMEEIWPGPVMKLVGPLVARSPGLRLVSALEIERHCSADEIPQGRVIDLVAFVNVDRASDIPFKARVE
jgi:hypothetical protein